MLVVRSYIFLLVYLSLLLPAGAYAAKPICGDNKCNGGETASTCPADCSVPEPGICGDGVCGADESCSGCETDCGACPPVQCNNDGVCNQGEDCLGCPGDCPGVTGGKPGNRFCCGLESFCGTEAQCGVSCGTPSSVVCGNGVPETGEECDDGNTADGDGCSSLCLLETSGTSVPANQFNAGDSIGEGEAADGTIGEAHHETVWSTGYDGGDIVNSLNERFESKDAASYYENTSSRDPAFNMAVSGAEMVDFAAQANDIAASAAGAGGAGQVTVLLGNNDVCAESLSAMTDPVLFKSRFKAGLDVLAASPTTQNAYIQVSSIPAIYWLWEAKRNDFWCRAFAWPFVPCENLLDNPADDCQDSASRLNPDVIYAGDGSNCMRRKQFHAKIRDIYNPILRDLVNCYNGTSEAPAGCPNYSSGNLTVKLPNAYFIDIFDVKFSSTHVNGGDCFHPSTAGHALLSEKQWCRAAWSDGDPLCSP
ncbi:MAG: SGNH/GDSL hydrolase family protein [Gammaproteobacteria bacterium]